MKNKCIPILSLSVLFFASCTTSPAATAVPTESAEYAQPVLSDAQIIQVLATMNQGEVDLGKIAAKKAKHGEVKDFAKMMIKDHSKGLDADKKLARTHDLHMDDSDLDARLKEDSKAFRESLKQSEKSVFDRTYMNQMVMLHEKTLSTLKETLLPQAVNPELQAHLKEKTKSVQAHLNHARDIGAKRL